MWAPIAFKLPTILLLLLLQTQHYYDLRADAVSAAASLAADTEVGAEHADSYNIRHGRSKVRHSNEKEHILWGGMRPQNVAAVKATPVKGYIVAARRADASEANRKNATIVSQSFAHTERSSGLLADYVENGAPQNVTTRDAIDKRYDGSSKHQNRVGRVWSSYSTSSIQTGNGHLFGSDYWRNSDVNGSLINATDASSLQRLSMMSHGMTATRAPMATALVSRRSLGYPFEALPVTETPDAAGASGLVTTEAPVTHRIRKLHMKKIMESIRNNVDKRLGAKLSKNHHRSLLTAEQLQGRPMDVELNQAHNAATDDITTDSDVSVADSASSEDGGSFERTEEAVSGVDDEDKGDNFDSRNYDANNDINNVNVGIENVNGDVEVASDSVGDELESDDVNSEDVSNNALESNVDSSSDELGEVLQLADDLDVPDNSMEDIYQNDEYPVTSPSYVTTSSDGSTELNENAKMFTTFTPFLVDGDDSYATEILSDGTVNVDATTTQTPALKPPKKVTTKLQLVPKTTATTKLIPLPTMPTKDVVQSKLALKRAWKNQTISVAPQNEITAIERPLWPTDSATPTKPASKVVRVKAKPIKSNGNSIIDSSEPPDLFGTIRLESTEMANDTAEYSELEPKNYTTNKLLTPAVPGSTAPKAESDEFGWSASNISVEPNHLASTSVGGIGLERQQAYDIEEISFENVGLDNLDDITMDDGHMDNRHAHGFPVSNSGDVSTDVNGGEDGNETEGEDDTNRFLAGVVDAANEDEIYDWDEISRNNRRNLMRGRDVVTKFLQIVETQHLLGANCEAGTSLNLGEGVVDRYAQDRFRVEAEVAVNRANMLTR
ncbi:uncharacterized protein LOC118743783 [Rhagoletis pomonella]|uniref:uncharacterized protein LOC118743783 n=1 Tax=Rhagoletis pomonella TaxID=28610 RepID=UPI001782DF57|nr:uncharacterized protein LOC118743783 [Rhagoletis pomonella]